MPTNKQIKEAARALAKALTVPEILNRLNDLAYLIDNDGETDNTEAKIHATALVYKLIPTMDIELFDVDKILDSLQLLIKNQKANFMVTEQQYRDLATAFDGATNVLKIKLDNLESKIKGNGLSPEVEESIFADFKAIKDRLQALGADPANPVPPEEPGEDAGTDDETDG